MLTVNLLAFVRKEGFINTQLLQLNYWTWYN